ncbi:MAG: sodium:alanine symporter family protein [Clostridia bacterium]|nr:sodium:alanine symporter family protein [Clostridia bacterium]
MENFMAMVEKINSTVNGWVWGPVMLVFLVGTGILITCGLKFFQVGKISYWMKNTFGVMFKKNGKKDKSDKAITPFQAICTALGGTVGVGNVVGVTTAIIAGGPGAIFWMWVAAFFGMMTKYAEIVLGIFYRKKTADGEWLGGAMVYLKEGFAGKKGLKTIGKILGVLFALFCILASFGIGNMSQINTIAANFEQTFSIPAVVTGVILMALMAFMALGGLKRVASFTEKLVPFMSIFYIIGALIIIGTNFSVLGSVFVAIFKGAFGFDAIAGGAIGVVISKVAKSGIARGVFSNEAGLGSSALVHSSADVKEPVKQGMWGVFEVFVDTIIICTLSALVVLSSGVVDLSTGLVVDKFADIGASVLVTEAFASSFGTVGGWFATIAIFFFAISTVIGWFIYGSKSCEFLFGKTTTDAYKAIFISMVMVGATMDLSLAWDISDTFNGLMAIPNLLGVLILAGPVFKITKNFFARKNGADIKPMLSAYDDIQAEMEAKED